MNIDKRLSHYCYGKHNNDLEIMYKNIRNIRRSEKIDKKRIKRHESLERLISGNKRRNIQPA